MSTITTQQQQAARNRVSRKQFTAQLGRNGATELLATNAPTMAAAATFQMGNFVTIDRPVVGFMLRSSGRLVVGTAAYTTGVPESFPNLVQRVFVQGQHVIWGNTTPWDISGSTLFSLPLAFQARGNTFLSSTTRQGDPGMPFVTTANLITTPATGTIDYDVYYWMPCGPYLGASPSSKRYQLDFMWRPEDWNGPLIFNVGMSDNTALGTPAGGTTTTWTAFGAATGTPSLQLFAVYSQLGKARFGYIPGSNPIMIRNEQSAPTLLIAVTSQQTLLAQLQSYITTNIVVKSGILLTGTSAGVQAFASLSDVQLDQTSVLIGNRYLKNTGSNLAMKSYDGMWMNTTPPQGYFCLPFTESGNPMTALRADDPSMGINANLQIKTAVLTASANNRQQYLQEYVQSAMGQKGAFGPYLPADLLTA